MQLEPLVPISTFIIAGLLLLCATLIRALRLYLSLGKLRPQLLYICLAHFAGVSLGYLTGAFVYELVVILFLSHRQWKNIIPVLFSLMLIRGFDAVILLSMALGITSESYMRQLVFFLIVLMVLIWICIYAIIPLLHRFERNMLELQTPVKNDVGIVRYSYTLRQNLSKLPWKKKGTIAMIALVSLFAWLLEWLSIYLFINATDALNVVVGRVSKSLGILITNDSGNAIYDHLMLFVYAAFLILALTFFARFWRAIDKKHSNSGLAS